MTGVISGENATCLETAIKRGLVYLFHAQLPYGEFKTYVSTDQNMICNCRYISTLYITTFVHDSLGFVKDQNADQMRKKAQDFLMEEIESPGIWRFFTTNRSLRKKNGSLGKFTPIGIIPDLDDTSCVSYCLKSAHIHLDNQRVFLNNRNPQGVFYTWLMDLPPRNEYAPETQYLIPPGNDICCGVNANILLYLGETEETKAVCAYLNKCILQGTLLHNNVHFYNEIILYYLISRCYHQSMHSLESSKPLAISNIISGQLVNKSFANPFHAALTVCSILNYDEFMPLIESAIQFILKTQHSNGSWPKSPFCTEFNNRYYGSEELTTAICLESLSRYRAKYQ